MITFNFGLHNLQNDTDSERQYVEELTNITAELAKRNATTKLLYVLTTPQMLDYRQGNFAVEDHNAQAREIMKQYNVPVLDMYKVVTDHCGKVYTDCDWCLKSPCQFHYQAAGYQALAAALKDAIRNL